MSKPDFDSWKFAGSLPAILVMHKDCPCPVYAGAASPGFDIDQVTFTDDRLLMQQVIYTTYDRVHGLLHYDGATQLFFIGYKCGQCGQVFLVPSTVGTEKELAESLRHFCMEPPSKTGTYGSIERGQPAPTPTPTPKFDLRTRVLHIVQDIGRPGEIGSADCEQWADAIMDLVKEAEPKC